METMKISPIWQVTKRLDQLKDKLEFYFKEGNLVIDDITVIGFTYRRDVKGDENNYKLSERRALSVYEYIAPALNDLSDEKLEWVL